jgi:hypothetical protein
VLETFDCVHNGDRACTRQQLCIIVPIWNLQRSMDVIGPLDQVSDYISPDAYDVLISDIQPEDLPGRISKVLGTEYLSPAKLLPWPVSGKIWGTNRRTLITLPVSVAEMYVNVHFILDTGAPTTFVADSTLEALHLQEWQL